jgi:hypothetical protein
MSRQMLSLSLAVLAIIGATAGLLTQLGGHQRLGPPGIRTHHPLPGSIRLQADLPERVLDYESQSIDMDDITLNALPRDTSFGQRRYKAPDGLVLDVRAVLMGTDRASIHKPQICLPAQGWRIDEVRSTQTNVSIQRPYAYELPVMELVATKAFSVDGQTRSWSGVYVYWYVAEDGLSASASGFERMWSMATKLLKTGVLQRWAYISCFAACPPGQEGATFDRMKKFISAAVPEFQLYPKAKLIAVTVAP